MKKLLAIEAGASLCSVALCCETGIHERADDQPRAHTRLMLAFVDELLSSQKLCVADLDAVVFGAGPGSFTGIRLAAAVAKSLGYAAGVPVIAISSLAAMAQACYSQTNSDAPCLVLRDARMGEYYLAEYQRDASGDMHCLVPDQLLSAGSISTQYASLLVHENDEWLASGACLPALDKIAVQTKACDLLQLALPRPLPAADSALFAQVNYLRDKTGWKNIQQQKQS